MNVFEQVNDMVVLDLDISGFEDLSEKQKKLSYHLSKAALWGNYISFVQGSKYNLMFLSDLKEVYQSEKIKEFPSFQQEIKSILFTLFFHGGVYHSTTGEKIDFNFSDSLKVFLDTHFQSFTHKLSFLNEMKQYRTVQNDEVDIVAESGGNHYQNLTTEEVKQYRKTAYNTELFGEKQPMFGLNEVLVKNQQTGEIVSHKIYKDGLYGKYIVKIVDELEKAIEFSENEKQKNSIKSLITFYKSGDVTDFDKHAIDWVTDTNSDIYFVNGLIETYDDPLGVIGSYEGMVAFKNPTQTKKVKKIIDNIQWFEDNSPIAHEFKKKKAVGLSASSITVIAMGGDLAPVLPLGINLPNSDWIRKEYGSKSVTLSNVDSSRGSYEKPIREEMFLPEYLQHLEKYSKVTGTLSIDLHEITGHGSGQLLENVSGEALEQYYSVIEEARADLVSLYYIPDEKLKEIGIYDEDVNVKDAALAHYISYFTNGLMTQLRRVRLGNDLTQAHMRNRQLITSWVMKNADKSIIQMLEIDKDHFIKINNVDKLRVLIGDLLKEIQRIKSTGDLQAAKYLVDTYGTKVNQSIHKEVLERLERLKLASSVGFITPILIKDENDNVIVKHDEDFVEHCLKLADEYIFSI